MFSLSTYWIFLLGIRPFSEFINVPSVVFTIVITGLQLLNLFIIFEKEKLRLYIYHLFLIFFILITIHNFATLATVNIVLAVLLLKNENLKKVSTICFFSILSALFIYISLLALDILQDKIVTMPKGTAHTFGFDNSNGIGSFVLQFTLIIYVFIVSNFKNSFLIYFLFIPNYYIYKLSLGRTSFYTSFLFFLLLVLFSVLKKIVWKKRKIISLLPLLLFVCTLVACSIYQQYPILDVLFTTRFSKNAVHLHSMSIIDYFIGYKLPEGAMDSAYLAQLFAGGILSVYFFISIAIKGIAAFNLNDWFRYAPVVICLLVSGFAENTFSSFSLQTILFYKILSDQFPMKKVKQGYLYANI